MTAQPIDGNELLVAALALHDAGLCVLPAARDGSKKPFGTWEQYQKQRPSREWVAEHVTNAQGIGAVCGQVSGGLEMLELEGRAIHLLPTIVEAAENSNLGPLWRRVTAGYLEQTPSGGLHILVRCPEGARANTRLARRRGDGKTIDVLLETRGEGGWTVLAPSGGTTHPTGRPWKLLAGSAATIVTVTADERDALHTLFASFDEMPAVDNAAETAFSRTHVTTSGAISPGDDYTARTTWDDVLRPHGWHPIGRHGDITTWRRPGKTIGGSATSGYGTDRLYVFTTSTELETDVPYSRFAAYTTLEHGGDFKAAARALSAAGYGHAAPEPARPVLTIVGAADATTPTTYTRTDDGNALRLVDQHVDVIRYVPQRGQWLHWNGHRWTWDDQGAVRELGRAIARALPQDSKEEQKHRAWSLSARGLAAMQRVAETDPRIATAIGDLDARPLELNTPGGVVDLRTGDLRAPDPAALHTRSTTVTPAEQPAPQWARFLADTFAGDPALTTYVQQLLGISLIGQVLEQLLPFAYGSGANGKTTLIGVATRLIGIGDTGYSISAPAELLLQTSHQQHPTEIARLSGARLVATSELDEGQRFAEARVKLLTGRDTIAGRFMRQDWFSFTPTHTLWLLGNYQPTVRAGGDAFWRRVCLLPFVHTVPKADRDPSLEDRLVNTEGPAILNWMIQGAVHYLAANRLEAPESVAAATQSYATDQDTVQRFVTESCQLGPAGQQGYAIRTAELRQAYEQWCHAESEQPVSAKTFTASLRSRHNVETTRDMKARYYTGIRLQPVMNETANATDSDDTDTQSWFR